MEYMKRCEDNSFDLAIVDPPYGHGTGLLRNGKTKTKLAKAGNHKFFDNSKGPNPEYFIELKRVSKNQIIWGANHLCNQFNAASPAWIIWNKHTSCNFADGELAHTSFKTAAKIFDYPWNGMIQGTHGNKSKNEIRIHPTQKPVALYNWILHNYAESEQRILDTHLGSGSSAIAAHYFGCDFVGMEIDKDYYNSAVERFNQETAQLDLLKNT